MDTTAARLLRLLSLLQSRRQWSAADLADRLTVTERTVRRDVTRLRELGYPVVAAPGVGGGYRLGRGTKLPPLLLDDEEAVAVAVSLQTAAGGTVTGGGEAAARALAKLDQVLPGRLRTQVAALAASTVSMSAGTPTVDSAALAALATACRDSERVRFDYQRHDGTESHRRVEPYRLVCTGRRWYLVARDLDRDAWRTFRVDRIDHVVATGWRFDAEDPPDAVEFVSRGVGVAPYPHQARIRLHAPVETAMEWIPPSTGLLTRIDSATCELAIGADSLHALAREMVMLDCDFEVLEPPELVDLLRHVRTRLARL